ncbi:MAG: hypothetical protein WCK29_02160, partial [archaeon]
IKLYKDKKKERKTKTKVDPKKLFSDNLKRRGLEKMLELDKEEDGWAASYILVNEISKSMMEHPYLEESLKAVRHLKERKELHIGYWDIHYDDSILRQAENFVSLINEGIINFSVRSPNDYPFAKVFKIEGKRDLSKWNLIYQAETEKSIAEYEKGIPISSTNERVIHALAMNASFFGKKVEFKHPECATESWPKFWKFLNDHKY